MKVPNTPTNRTECICPNCPTYNKCMKEGNQRLFCAKGKTKCNPEKLGCLCGECPVASRYGLKKLYYCHIGPEE